MTAVIFVDLAHVHPVIDGVWHRAQLLGMPDPGQGITMLCGETAAAEYQRLEQRRAHGVPTMCPRCDLLYRQREGIPPQQDRLAAAKPPMTAQPARRSPTTARRPGTQAI